MKTISTITACCFVAVLASGCVSQGNQNVRHSQDQQYYVVRGTIENIEHVSSGSAGQSSGLGAVGGALVGGLLGNQVGKGTGKTVATVAGVAAGAYAGNEAEKHYSGSKDLYNVSIRTRDGRIQTYQQSEINGLRVGDYVRVNQNKVVRD